MFLVWTQSVDAHQSYKLLLSDGQLLVADEGMHEPRSIGSYSLRLYAPFDTQFPYDNFVSGVVAARDGSIERLLAADIDGDDRKEAVVVIRSAGSGGYLSGHAYDVDGNHLRLVARAEGLMPTADIIEALSAAHSATDKP